MNSRLKFHVKKGDEVEVICGNSKGSSGKILEVRAGKQQVLIEGVRIIKKHLRKSQDNPQGKIAERSSSGNPGLPMPRKAAAITLRICRINSLSSLSSNAV